MAAPVINSITLDKASYAPGQTITATVNYSKGTSAATQTLTGTATDSVSKQTGTISVTFTVNEPDTTLITLTDSGNRAWTLVSDNGSVAVFTAVA